MYFLSEPHTVANVRTFVRCRERAPVDSAEEGRNFQRLIAAAQHLPLSAAGEPRACFEDSELRAVAEKKGMFSGEGLEFEPSMTLRERQLAKRHIDHGLVLLRSLDRRLYRMLVLTVSDVVCVRVKSSGGGTASNILGVIWLSPHPNWTTIDYCECLLHEFIHLNLFLGDALYGLYVDARRVREPGALVRSAIRKARRPIDKSLHSACVATALLYYYHLLKMDSIIEEMLEPLEACVEELAEKAPTYLSPYGRAIVSSLEQFVNKCDYNLIDTALGSGEWENFDGPHSWQVGEGALEVESMSPRSR